MQDKCSICGTPLKSVIENTKGELLCEDCFIAKQSEKLNSMFHKLDMTNKLNEIRQSIADECISWNEIMFLQSHKQEVLNTGDLTLIQWAGITEEEYKAEKLN